MPTTRPMNSDNAFKAVPNGLLSVMVVPGTLYLNGTSVTVAQSVVTLAANSTTSVYINLAAGTVDSGTIGFPNGSYPIATVVTGASTITSIADARPAVWLSGMPLVGFATLSGTTTAVVPILPSTYVQLVGWARVTFYGSSDTISVRFGNTATAIDAGNNYNYRWGTMAAGGNTWSSSRDSTGDSNNSLIKMAAQDTTLSREINFSISNTSNKVKQMQMQAATETAGTSTLPSLDLGQGQWFNTTGQILSFQVLTAGGATFGGSIAFYGSK